MALKEYGVLPETYPLFDWDDFPDSHAALVPGGPTEYFKMDCWNAMVDALGEAMEAAGVAWYDRADSRTHEDAKIFDGLVKADKINMVVDNLINSYPMPVRWMSDEKFRGYIGRWWFSSKEKDVVYPEYFEEIAWRINQLIEILRGTWPVSEAIPNSILCPAPIDADLQKGYAQKIAASIRSSTQTSRNPLNLLHGTFVNFPKINIRTLQNLKMERLKAGDVSAWQKNQLTIAAGGRVAHGASVNAKPIIKSRQQAAIDFLVLVAATMASGKSFSSTTAKAAQSKAKGTSSSVLSESASVVSLAKVQNDACSAKTETFSKSTAEAGYSRPKHLSSAEQLAKTLTHALITFSSDFPIDIDTVKSESNIVALVGKLPPSPCGAAQNSATEILPGVRASTARHIHASKRSAVIAKPGVIQERTAPVFLNAKFGTAVACEIAFMEWESPEWVQGGLWIKQSVSVVQTEEGDLEVK